MNSRRLKIGVVGLAGGWSTNALIGALNEKTGKALLIEMDQCVADLGRRTVWCGDVNLCELDGIIVKKLGETYTQDMLDRLEILRFVEACGVRIFSSPRSIMGLLDRLSCTISLTAAGVPMPETTITEDVSQAVRAVERYGQAVLKPLYSTKARGMKFVDSTTEANLVQAVQAFCDAGNPVMYIQKKLKIPGRDLGVVFLGGEYVGTYARVQGPNSWNTTTREGGHYARHDPSAELIAMAKRAQAPFKLDMTGVDVVETESGPMVFEVSAFGGFRGLQDALQYDAARLYADYAVEELS